MATPTFPAVGSTCRRIVTDPKAPQSPLMTIVRSLPESSVFCEWFDGGSPARLKRQAFPVSYLVAASA